MGKYFYFERSWQGPKYLRKTNEGCEVSGSDKAAEGQQEGEVKAATASFSRSETAAAQKSPATPSMNPIC